ncbi:nucleoside-diphosphate kinase [Amycolatopsis minnesotensis]|uniref:Nucleoside diphosphate kinase-like domain-containing protein n=1 Tax=Amycolatopsis minnesotensis TaxID=337894 RepID=A0ABP5C3V3_9PSEU
MTRHAPPLPAALSCLPDKRAAFAADTYYQESAEQLAALTADVTGFATTHGVLLLKPDAVVTRSLLPALDWVRETGFRVVAAAPVRLTRTTVRALWYFQWNLATEYRRRLADLFAASTDSLVVVVRPERATEVPVPVLLTELKGPTDPAAREPGQLRHLLGDHGYLLNLAHTADEPADVLRELGVYFGQSERERVFTAALAGDDEQDRARKLAHELYAQAPRHDLGYGAAVERLRRAAPGYGSVRELIEEAWRTGAALDPWDTVVAGASVFPMRRKGFEPLLGGVTVAQWRRCAAEGQ